jgi:predicted O-methyltransferase YrrM
MTKSIALHINIQNLIAKIDDSKSKLDAYCEAHTTSQSDLLYQLERETYLKTLAPQMASGHLQGQLLTLLCQLIRPKIALEIGTFTGYATICIANGLPLEGKLHTIEVNEEIAYISNKYFEKSGLKDKIVPYIGDAATIVPTLPYPFDFVFIDAGKKDYAKHFDLVIDKVSAGGILLADNVLWSGKVAEKKRDKATQNLHKFNQKIQNDSRVENILLPIRDGLMVIRKK